MFQDDSEALMGWLLTYSGGHNQQLIKLKSLTLSLQRKRTKATKTSRKIEKTDR